MNITELCANCKKNNSCTMCWKTSNKKCPHFIQKTNADSIRAMSDEELAELLEEMTYDSMEHRAEYWLEWLKQPADMRGAEDAYNEDLQPLRMRI